MRIREDSSIEYNDPENFRARVVESIEELEQQFADGTIEFHAYVMKKRALLKKL